MPRPRSSASTTPTTEPPNAIIASAALMREEPQKLPRAAGSAEWQQQAWYFYDTVGEYRFGSTWLAQCISRVKLRIVEDTPDGGEEPVTEGPEVDALAALFGGESGQPQALAQMALHLSVPGETYVVGEVLNPDTADETEVWSIYSNEELQPKAGRTPGSDSPIVWVLDQGDGVKRDLDPETTVVIRIWRPHPRLAVEADSPSRAALPILREIEQLSKHLAASIDSRLAGAGILFVPSEITFATPVTQDGVLQGQVSEDGQAVTISDVDSFIRDLTEAMVTPINDRGHASAVVPIVVKAPGALLANIKHITFSTPLDEKATEQRTTNVGRLATTLDMPPEVLLGLSDSNHWSAWQIDESSIKAHVEPLVKVIVSGLTSRWLRPAVKGSGAEVNPRRRIVGDTSALRTRPDHSTQAVTLYDKGELSAEALRRENGFDEGDAPDPVELGRQLLLRQATSQASSPEVIVAAMHALGQYAIPTPADGAAGGAATPTEVVQGGRDLPDTPGAPGTETPALGSSGFYALAAAADLLCERAIERANNRMNNRGKQRRPIPSDQLGAALRGAWESLPRTAATLGVDAGVLQAACDRYCRTVLTEGAAHRPDALATFLRSQVSA